VEESENAKRVKVLDGELVEARKKINELEQQMMEREARKMKELEQQMMEREARKMKELEQQMMEREARKMKEQQMMEKRLKELETKEEKMRNDEEELKKKQGQLAMKQMELELDEEKLRERERLIANGMGLVIKLMVEHNPNPDFHLLGMNKWISHAAREPLTRKWGCITPKRTAGPVYLHHEFANDGVIIQYTEPLEPVNIPAMTSLCQDFSSEYEFAKKCLGYANHRRPQGFNTVRVYAPSLSPHKISVSSHAFIFAISERSPLLSISTVEGVFFLDDLKESRGAFFNQQMMRHSVMIHENHGYVVVCYVASG